MRDLIHEYLVQILLDSGLQMTHYSAAGDLLN
jgi:hypothetical protein